MQGPSFQPPCMIPVMKLWFPNPSRSNLDDITQQKAECPFKQTFFSPPAVFREATTDFTVDASPLTRRGGDHVKAEVRNPSGALTDCLVKDNADGTYSVEYTPFENGNTHTLNKKLYRTPSL